MAVAGNTMPCLTIAWQDGRGVILSAGNKPSAILTSDLEQAKTNILSGLNVSIPAIMRADLAEYMECDIVDKNA